MRNSIALTLIILALAVPWSDVACAGERIALLISSNEMPFNEAAAGFKDHLAKQGISVDYDVFALGGEAKKTGPSIKKIKAGGYRLVFTVGSLATDAATREIADIPIVACLVLRTDGLRTAPNATGVGLEFPLETQIEWLRRILPAMTTIGVIYNPAENGERVAAAARIAEQEGVRLEAEAARTPQDIPAALGRLARRADVLWGLADSLTLSPQIAKSLLLFSFRNSIPLIGPSAAWVKAGAIYSLDWDYGDLGSQCGDMALRILAGTHPAAIPVVAPRKVLYSLNLVTARQMRISLPEHIVRGAHQTY